MELDIPEVEAWRRWLVARQSAASSGGKRPDRACFLVFARARTPFSEMIQTIGGRWSIERCFEIGKSEVGLDDYELRSWHGCHRRITLCLLALAFLMILQLRSGENELLRSTQLAKA
jgi:SRSO17 transposase